jgi:putative DNA primase/helicase
LIDEEGALSPAVLSLTPDAKAAWVEFHDSIEAKLRTGGELYDVRDVASKIADNAARLAALLQIFCSNCSCVAVEHIESASRIAAWHLNESRRFFGDLALPVDLANPVRLDTWLIGYCRSERTNLVSTRIVQQYGPGRLREKADMEAAVRELEELGRARLVKEGTRKIIKVNPALLLGGDA